MEDNFFAELDAIIAESIAKSDLKAQRDKAKKKANNTALSPEARRAASQTFHELSAQIEAAEWAVTSLVALFTEQQCDGCGSTHRVFLQYMEVHSLIRKPSTTKWVRTSRPNPALPKETLIQPHRTHFCADCCEDHGFAFTSAKRLDRCDSALTISPTYHQEDINAQA